MSTQFKWGGWLKFMESKQFCIFCGLNYDDLPCANVSEQRFLNIKTHDHKNNWKCLLCKRKQPKGYYSNTSICVVSDGDVTVCCGVAKLCPQEKVKSLPVLENITLEVLFDEDLKVKILVVRQLKKKMRGPPVCKWRSLPIGFTLV